MKRPRRFAPVSVSAVIFAVSLGGSGLAADLARGANWAALASDQVAARVGDALTVVVYETASATNSAQSASRKTARFGAQLSTAGSPADGGELNLQGQHDGSGQSGRSDTMVAQITVVVTQVLPNGDLSVAGAQNLDVNGQRTRISVAGRVRRADITRDNRVLSSRLADAEIEYAGRGFVSRSAQPGFLSRLLSRLAF